MKLYYMGLDIHKRTTTFCLKEADGTRLESGIVESNRSSLQGLASGIDAPWIGGMEAANLIFRDGRFRPRFHD